MGGLEVVDPRFTVLYERAHEVLGSDERVEEVTIGGSVGAGTADQWSDLDLRIVANRDGYDSFLDDWPRWLAAITPTVFARTPIAPMVVNAVTTDGLTLDFVVYEGQAHEFPAPSEYTVGMLSGTRFADVGSALEYAVVEQLRGLIGPFISLVQREEHVRHVAGAGHLIGLLTTVFLAELGAPPLRKLWNQTLTLEQRAAVAALPPLRATRQGGVDFGLGLGKLLVTRARPLFGELGLDWPGGLARVAADRLRDQLHVETGHWLC